MNQTQCARFLCVMVFFNCIMEMHRKETDSMCKGFYPKYKKMTMELSLKKQTNDNEPLRMNTLELRFNIFKLTRA